MTTITLTLTVTEAERAALMARFIATAQAVTGEVDEDEGTRADPNGSKVDKFGVVWDARYHGANMTLNQDGSWRRKKGMSDQEKTDADNYEAGCRGASPVAAVAAGIAAPVAPAAAAPAPAADVPAFLQTGQFAASPAAPAAAPAPLMGFPGMPAAAPVAPPAPAPVSYPELIQAFEAASARIGGERLQAEIVGVYQRSGVTEMAQLEADPNIRILVKAELDKLA